MVVACPGSGKTRVLQTKAQYLADKYPLANVVAVTFTSDSATELKNRIAKAAPTEQAERIKTGTFHALCKEQLINSKVNFQLVSPRDYKGIIRRAVDRTGLGGDIKLDEAIGVIEHMKSRIPAPPAPSVDQALFKNYQTILKSNGLFDFADLIITAVEGMRNGTVAPLDAHFMLVDESQDTDYIQAAWINEHIKEGIPVTMVGDDDQSVYSWRHAQGYKGMDEFHRKTSATKITLDTNYRCKEEILSAAERLIKNNTARMPKQLKAHRGKGGVLTGYVFNSKPDEAEFMVETIAADPNGWAVICRTNKLLDGYESIFDEFGVPTIRVGGTSIWDIARVAMFLGILASVAGNKHIGLGNYLSSEGVHAEDIDKLMNARCLFSGDTDAAANICSRPVVTQCAAMMPGWKRNARDGLTEMVIEAVAQWYIKTSFNTDAKRKDIGLITGAKDRLKRMKGSLGQRLSLLDRKQKKATEEEGTVTLVTMHSAKGLEYPNVWLPASSKKVCPSPKSKNIPEERRLYYVAMTRAQDKLVVSTSIDDDASQFLAEANIPLIENEFRFSIDRGEAA